MVFSGMIGPFQIILLSLLFLGSLGLIGFLIFRLIKKETNKKGN